MRYRREECCVQLLCMAGGRKGKVGFPSSSTGVCWDQISREKMPSRVMLKVMLKSLCGRLTGGSGRVCCQLKAFHAAAVNTPVNIYTQGLGDKQLESPNWWLMPVGKMPVGRQHCAHLGAAPSVCLMSQPLQGSSALGGLAFHTLAARELTNYHSCGLYQQPREQVLF